MSGKNVYLSWGFALPEAHRRDRCSKPLYTQIDLPNMGTVRNWLSKNILANIVVPDLLIVAGFDLWELKTECGESFRGCCLKKYR